ncbi:MULTISPECIES: DUF1565 domain-containing protein [unclassified Nodularia (in: cyanobacteria)]|uniref:DUF1565 domain-containing protein n=1 Tax=unclassified Nodularia (in: cyanobacteria) TaxID=2656917 RepID=UPI00187F2D27|nr:MULTISPECIES: DUF1565 domain-containing protein [unclassified Nodularia (in: cyanobacteria)]MBE9198482.1 DUF1565 domain-containing protein [Nodularia sp. LEGE 06071]MCC2691053.1 DUF1565 domain-containing protein [Nodularia sp. LEGE 04288]
MYSKYPQAESRQLKLNPQADRSNSSLEVLPLVFSILYFTLGLGVTGITLLSLSPGRVLAQMPSLESTVSEVKLLFVNPNVGNNTVGNGTESAPLKTITQALQLASANTMIMLSPGTYSADTGEVFPLKLKSGVAIQGDTNNKGQGITIQGGGGFLSSSFGGQNVTIIGADNAELRGVTVTNPNPRGYGLWIESSNPVIANNTFTGSTQDGISLTGNSAPIIRQNYFHRNGANGMTIGGNSQPEVRENVFEQTGFGINITQNAAPMLSLNQIQNNRSGIIVQANARPILRNNVIQGNREDGLVAIAQAIPNLGTIAEPGGNEFRNNTRHDINASATKEIIPAAGNNLSQNRIAGKVDFNAQTAPTANIPQPRTVANRPIPVSGEITFSAPSQPNQTNQSQINYVNIDPNIVEFAAPQSPPFGESALSPVTNSNTPATQTTAYNRTGVRYRVVVNVATDREQDLVRNLAPDAFPTMRQGRRVMQVGVFSDRHNADEILKVLNSHGLKTTLEPLN